MSAVEFGPAGPAKPRVLRTGAAENAVPVAVREDRPSQATQAGAGLRSDALDPGAPPHDGDRVAQIRRAIETGSYPVIPYRIADAMIAAGLLLRSGK